MGKTVNLQMTVRCRAWDRFGRITHDVTQQSESLVQAFLAALLANMAQIAMASTMLDITDTAKTITSSTSASLQQYRALGAATDADEGIVIGTSATAVDITDNKMVALIANGAGAGQMVYALQTYPTDVTIADPNATFVTSRNFNNNSGGTITIREVGIYCQMIVVSAALADFCMVRDTPTALAVLDGGGAQVEYTFQISE